MNASEAKCLAEFLGKPYMDFNGCILHMGELNAAPFGVFALSSADLLLACLERAASLGLLPALYHSTSQQVWWCDLGHAGHGVICESTTPLAAMIAAIVAYQGQTQGGQSDE